MAGIVRSGPREAGSGRPSVPLGVGGVAVALVAALIVVLSTYNSCRLEVPTGSQAILVRKTGLEMPPGAAIAPAPKGGVLYKGVQPGVLTEGRYFYNPFFWSWEIREQADVPAGKIGIRIALSGEDMPVGQILADPGQKGIQRDVLKPGRYAYNWYAEEIEIRDSVTVPAGFQGVVTLLAGRMPKDPNVTLVGPGERGVQKQTLAPGTYLLNPYDTRVSLIDCRSKRFNLGDEGDMDFLSADGFPVRLDGAIEFRVMPEKAAEVFVLYNEDKNGDVIDEEIISKIITPESRSICRISGSRLTGGQFIQGNDRELFQQNLDKSLKANCKKQGIDILAVAVTSIQPPDAIASPVRDREVAKKQTDQYEQERLQQESEAQLRVQELLADQRKAIVEAEREVVEKTTHAEQEQSVAKTEVDRELAVAKINREAVKSRAAKLEAEAKAAADVIRAKNRAELSGLEARVRAFQGDGSSFAENLLIGKIAPAYRTILTNSDGPLMDLFGRFAKHGTGATPAFPRNGGTAGAPAADPDKTRTEIGRTTPARDASSKPVGSEAATAATETKDQ